MSKLKSITGPFKELYDEAKLPGVIRRSLTLMLFGNLFGNLHGIICGTGTTAMVGFAGSLGADDMFFAILTAIAQVCVIMQIPYSILVNRTHKRKKYMLTFGLVSRVLWLIFGFIPLIVPARMLGGMNLQLWSLIFMVGIICLCGNVIGVCWLPWLTDINPLLIRSRWLATRDVILSVVNIIAGFGVALLLDNLPIEIRYKIIFLIGGVCGVMDMVCFGFCKEVYSSEPKKTNVFKVFKNVFKDKTFMRFLIYWTAWSFAANVGGVYRTPYAMNVMGLNNTQITLFATMAAAFSAILVSKHWGRATFQYGNKNVMLFTCIITALMPLFYIFSVPGSIWPTFLFNIIGAWFWVGSNLSATNMYLSIPPDDEKPSYIAVYSVITAFFGATLGSLVGGSILKFMANHQMFTGWFDRYKVIFVLESALRMLFTLLLVPRMDNDSNKTMRDMFDAIFKVKRRFKN